MSAVMTKPAAASSKRAELPDAAVNDPRPSLVRLTTIELRKMFDTRSGFWLPICVGLVAIATVLLTVLTGPDTNHTFAHVFGNAVIPTAILLPLIGVLLVTGEFSQRTALTTFTLVPSRARVMVAKLGASVVCSFVALVFCLVVAAGATAVHPSTGVDAWSLHFVLIPQSLLYLATAMITGVAFGAALLVSAPAIVIYLLLPTVWSVLTNAISGLNGIANWLEAGQTLDPLTRHALGATDWLQAGATLAVWMVLPLAIGWRRVMTRDVG